MVEVFMGFVVVGEVGDGWGEVGLELGIGVCWGVVIVEDGVDRWIGVEEMYRFGKIGGGIEDEVMVGVKVGEVGGVGVGEGEE